MYWADNVKQKIEEKIANTRVELEEFAHGTWNEQLDRSVLRVVLRCDDHKVGFTVDRSTYLRETRQLLEHAFRTLEQRVSADDLKRERQWGQELKAQQPGRATALELVPYAQQIGLPVQQFEDHVQFGCRTVDTWTYGARHPLGQDTINSIAEKFVKTGGKLHPVDERDNEESYAALQAAIYDKKFVEYALSVWQEGQASFRCDCGGQATSGTHSGWCSSQGGAR